jgi:large subunit ribosomal protein L5
MATTSKKTTKSTAAGASVKTAKSTATEASVKTEKSTAVEAAVKPRLKERYQKEIIPLLIKEFSYKNPMQVPRLSKIVLNVGMGEAISNVKLLDAAAQELALLTGQRPVLTKAKKSIAGFKLREGVPIGCKVTLRGDRMYEFLDRLVSTALPRIRDFKGVPTGGFDGAGNFTTGIKEQLIFPELKYDEIMATHGMDITIVTTARNNEEGRSLLKYFGMPFRTEGARG